MRLQPQVARVNGSAWLHRASYGVLILTIPIWLYNCRPSSVGETGPVTAADQCDEDLKPDNLVDFAKKCAAATGEDVPGFNCNDGALVPETNLSGSYPNQFCDRPNVLNHVCDPNSRFQVLKQTDDVAIVAHCRKQDLGDDKYGDIAVIQYNRKNGATCFYQALGVLDAKVTAPSEGNGSGKFPWLEPMETAGIM